MNRKKFLKWLKYLFLFFIALLAIGVVFMTREGMSMYGQLTERVDHTLFKPEEGTFLIQNVNIVASEEDSLISGQNVLIENGLITAIDSVLNIPSEVKVIDGSGKYLIPGLIDTHVHLFQSQNDLLLYLANGVTEIRELIGEEDHLEWRDQIEKGEKLGPKMFVASPRLGSFEPLEGWFMSYSQGFMNVPNAEKAKETVKELHEQGFDGIKVYSHLNKESYLAINEAASKLGMPVFGHIPWSVELSDIWESGQSGIAHFEELMNALSREFAEGRNLGSFYEKEEEFLEFIDERGEGLASNLIKSDITVTSTLWLTESFYEQRFNIEEILKEVELEYANPGISEWVSYIPQGLGWLPEVNRYKIQAEMNEEELLKDKKYWDAYGKACQLLATNLSKFGVKIMTGTDANLPPTVPGFSLHDELGALNRAGMSNAEVLKSATVIPAEWLKSNSGRILPGYMANLVLLDKNPLEAISNTKAINMVINRGRIFDRGLLDRILAAVKEANDSSRNVNIDKYISDK